MYSLRLECSGEEADFLCAELWEAGTAGIRELDDALIAGFESDERRLELLARFAGHNPRWSEEEPIDWVEATERAWPGREIGRRIFLAPTWCKEETPSGRVRVVHNPGQASGTGEHPCTQLALGALEAANLAGKSVADIGAGSGLLAIAALRFGARRAVGVDHDEAALETARENFALNDLPALLAAGSAECLREGSADVTVANISGTVLLDIADELLRVTGGKGTLIVTGFREEELAAMEETFGAGEITFCDGWCCLRVAPA